MQNGLVYLRPTRLAYVRVKGPYEQSIPDAWERMLAWLEVRGLNSSTGRGYGLARDNPARVGADNCRYDACVLVMPYLEERVNRELGIITLPAGPYVRKREAGSYDAIRSLIPSLHETFAAPSGLRLDDNRPLVTIYLDDPRHFSLNDLRADICVPVAAGSARGRNGATQAAA